VRPRIAIAVAAVAWDNYWALVQDAERIRVVLGRPAEKTAQLVRGDRGRAGAHPPGEQLEEPTKPNVIEHGRGLDDLGRRLLLTRIHDAAQAVGEVVRKLTHVL
jgi:hypothetical protein